MRLTPAQLAVHLICGQAPGWFDEAYPTLCERLSAGRAALVRITGKDFAYDLAAWHAHLKETREGGYTWGRTIVLPKVMKEALASESWRAAAAGLT